MLKRILLIVGVVVTLLLVAGGVMYAFGTPQAPTATVPLSEEQEVPAPDPNSPFAIQIPGCVCHSDDPKIVEEHSQYRMNQCAGCHAGETPTSG